MWQDAKEIITRRMRAIAGFTPLDICFLFSLYCLKGLSNGVNLHSAIVCVITNVEFANANIQQGLKLEHSESDKTLWTGTI